METEFLFAKPSALSGAARTLDLWALFDSYNSSIDGKQADAIAMYLDWNVAGSDLWDAYEQMTEEIGLEKE
jgi:hypothetical protein